MTMRHSRAALYLLDSGNLELDYIEGTPDDEIEIGLQRFGAIIAMWDNPEFKALLDRFVAADRAAVQ